MAFVGAVAQAKPLGAESHADDLRNGSGEYRMATRHMGERQAGRIRIEARIGIRAHHPLPDIGDLNKWGRARKCRGRELEALIGISVAGKGSCRFPRRPTKNHCQVWMFHVEPAGPPDDHPRARVPRGTLAAPRKPCATQRAAFRDAGLPV